VKPFRGKPKKPKRSNGEIHRQRRWLRVGGRCPARVLRGSRAGTLPCVDVRRSSSCTSPQVRTSRPAGCRSTARVRCLSRRAVKRHATNPRSPGRLLGGTRKVSGRTRAACALSLAPLGGCAECVARARGDASRPSQARATVHGGYGPSAVPGPGPLLVNKVRIHLRQAC
jgi:hypothetical protein